MAGFYRENDHQPAIRHLEYVKRRVDDAVDHFNERYPDRPITKSIYFIGTDYEGMPGCVGGRYSYKDGKWEFYKVDDRYHLLVKGPFSDDGIICSIVSALGIPSTVYKLDYPSEEELRIQLSGCRLKDDAFSRHAVSKNVPDTHPSRVVYQKKTGTVTPEPSLVEITVVESEDLYEITYGGCIGSYPPTGFGDKLRIHGSFFKYRRYVDFCREYPQLVKFFEEYPDLGTMEAMWERLCADDPKAVDPDETEAVLSGITDGMTPVFSYPSSYTDHTVTEGRAAVIRKNTGDGDIIFVPLKTISNYDNGRSHVKGDVGFDAVNGQPYIRTVAETLVNCVAQGVWDYEVSYSRIRYDELRERTGLPINSENYRRYIPSYEQKLLEETARERMPLTVHREMCTAARVTRIEKILVYEGDRYSSEELFANTLSYLRRCSDGWRATYASLTSKGMPFGFDLDLIPDEKDLEKELRLNNRYDGRFVVYERLLSQKEVNFFFSRFHEQSDDGLYKNTFERLLYDDGTTVRVYEADKHLSKIIDPIRLLAQRGILPE